jgi:hypothetical protein
MPKAERNVLASREQYDIDNWHAANIIANSDTYPPVMKEWASMVLAKGAPVKRGTQQALIETPKADLQRIADVGSAAQLPPAPSKSHTASQIAWNRHSIRDAHSRFRLARADSL